MSVIPISFWSALVYSEEKNEKNYLILKKLLLYSKNPKYCPEAHENNRITNSGAKELLHFDGLENFGRHQPLLQYPPVDIDHMDSTTSRGVLLELSVASLGIRSLCEDYNGPVLGKGRKGDAKT